MRIHDSCFTDWRSPHEVVEFAEPMSVRIGQVIAWALRKVGW